MRIRAIRTGPENPARVLAPALLSRSIAAFESIQAIEAATSNQASFMLLLAIVFDVCRTVFDKYEAGPINICRDDQGEYCVDIYRKFMLTAKVDGGTIIDIYLSRHALTVQKLPPALSEWTTLRRLVAGSLEPCAIQNLLIGQKAICKAATDTLKNCPYNPAAAVIHLHKWRSKIVSLVCTPEDRQTVTELKGEIESRPRLLALRGWCGGNVLHPCCRLGNVRQLRLLLDAISSHETQHKLSIYSSDVIDGQNIDGCTPLYIARQYEQTDAAQIMLDAGADPTICDRFGSALAN